MTLRGKILFATLALIWGIPYLLIKVALGALTPASLVFLRTALGALLLLPFVLQRGNLRPLVSRWRPLLAYTVVELAIPWVLLSDAERRVSSSMAGLMVATVPLAGALLSRFTGDREHLGVLELAGLVLGFTGVAVLLGFGLGSGDARTMAQMLIVILGYALGPWIIARFLSDLPVLEVVTASLAFCALVFAPIGIHQLPHRMPPLPILGSVAALGVLCTAVAFIAFFNLIAEVGSTRATVVTFLNPAVAVLAGVLLLGEPFTASTAAGFALILGGAWLATGRGRGLGRLSERLVAFTQD